MCLLYLWMCTRTGSRPVWSPSSFFCGLSLFVWGHLRLPTDRFWPLGLPEHQANPHMHVDFVYMNRSPLACSEARYVGQPTGFAFFFQHFFWYLYNIHYYTHILTGQDCGWRGYRRAWRWSCVGTTCLTWKLWAQVGNNVNDARHSVLINKYQSYIIGKSYNNDWFKLTMVTGSFNLTVINLHTWTDLEHMTLLVSQAHAIVWNVTESLSPLERIHDTIVTAFTYQLTEVIVV